MPLQGSGSISISEIATEFGGTAPHALSEYYRDGDNVDSTKIVTVADSTYVTDTNSRVPIHKANTDYTLPQALSGLNNLACYVTTTTVPADDTSPETVGNTDGTYTVQRTGRVYFLVQGGGGGAGEWYGATGGGGGGGGVYGYFSSLNANTVISVRAGGGGTGGHAQGGGNGGDSYLTVSGVVRARANGGTRAVQTTAGSGGTTSTSNVTVLDSGNGENGAARTGSSVAGGRGWNTQEGATAFDGQPADSTANVNQTWVSGSDHGWGDGGSGQVQNQSGRCGAPGIVWIWQIAEDTQTINQDVPTSGAISMDDFYSGDGG